MKSKEYWKKRAEDISNLEFEKVEDYKKQLEFQYKQALMSIQADMEKFHKNFANNNQISITDARKILDSNKLKEFKMTLEEFSKKAKNNKNLKWEKELNDISYKVRMTRLEALKIQIKNSLENLYDNQHEDTTDLLKDIYSDAYYKNLFEIYKGIGVGVNFTKLNDKAINKSITEKWQGSNYSDRIWKNKNKLIKELEDVIPQSIIRGDSLEKTSKILAERMKVNRASARRLVNTESAQILTKATFDSYSKSGVIKKYEILATLDLRTSNRCREMDGKIFDLNDRIIGVNAPPFHPNCRTTTIPYFDDSNDIERIARDNDDKNYYVNGNTNYSDWYKEHVINNPEGLAAEKKFKNKSSDKKQFKKYKNILGEKVPNTLKDFQDLKYNNSNDWDRLAYNYKLETIYNLDRLKNTENFIPGKIKHILEGEVNKRGKAVGYHCENIPTKKGTIIESTRSKVNDNGIYRAKVIVDGVPKVAKSTFFPTTMTPQQIIDAINEAYNTRVSTPTDEFIGTTSYGFKIGMYLDNDHITTAYPKF